VTTHLASCELVAHDSRQFYSICRRRQSAYILCVSARVVSLAAHRPVRSVGWRIG